MLNLYKLYLEIFGYYQLLSRRFPYAIYYKIENNIIVVWRDDFLAGHKESQKKVIIHKNQVQK